MPPELSDALGIVQAILMMVNLAICLIDLIQKGRFGHLNSRLALSGAITILALIRWDIVTFVIFSLLTALTADVLAANRRGNH